ncbi:hypothetical protein V6N13_091466 [Hibiscus sabdariffa]
MKCAKVDDKSAHEEPEAFDLLLSSHVQGRQRGQILHGHNDLGGLQRRIRSNELHLTSGFRPNEGKHNEWTLESDGAVENEGETRGLVIDGQSLVAGQSEVVQEGDAHASI